MEESRCRIRYCLILLFLLFPLFPLPLSLLFSKHHSSCFYRGEFSRDESNKDESLVQRKLLSSVGKTGGECHLRRLLKHGNNAKLSSTVHASLSKKIEINWKSVDERSGMHHPEKNRLAVYQIIPSNRYTSVIPFGTQ